jgi:hypothetical protein
MIVELENKNHQYFTQWRIDDLIKLADNLTNLGLNLENAKIWYDDQEDYHMLQFSCNGKQFVIRYYKVYTAFIDGKTLWQGCVRSDLFLFEKTIAENALTPA